MKNPPPKSWFNWKSEAFHEIFFGFQLEKLNFEEKKMAEMGGMKFFFWFKDERGKVERVDKVTRGEAECDKRHLARYWQGIAQSTELV